MNKRIRVKILSSKGHETCMVEYGDIYHYLTEKLDHNHAAFIEPMKKVINTPAELKGNLDRIREIIIIPKIRGG